MSQQNASHGKSEIQILVTTARGLRKSAARDHAINVVKAALNAVPIIGGSLASLIDDYIPKQKEERLVSFTQKLCEALSRVSDRIDREFITSERFAFLFEQCYRAAAAQYHEETLRALRGVLVNSTIRFDVGQELKEEFIRLAEMLRPPHLYVLEFFEDPGDKKRYPYRGPESGIRSYRDQIAIMIKAYCFPDAEKDFIVAILSLLQANGLINDPYSDKPPDTIFRLKKYLTPLGKSFLEFIKEPKSVEK